MAAIDIHGSGGDLRVGYQRAASLGRWHLEGDWTVFALTGTVESVNGAWCGVPGQRLVLPLPGTESEWIWDLADAPITAAGAFALTLRGAPRQQRR